MTFAPGRFGLTITAITGQSRCFAEAHVWEKWYSR